MTTCRTIISALEKWAPPSWAEDWDSPGLHTGSPDDEVRGVVVALDCDERACEFAVKHGASMIVSHHPVIFKPLTSLSGPALSPRVITGAIRRSLVLYSAHTNLDKAPGGVSWSLARKLGLQAGEVLVPERGNRLKFVVFVPAGHVDVVRSAAADAGAGTIGGYTACSFAASGEGTFVPPVDAAPFSGRAGELSREPEHRLEMMVPSHLAGAVIGAARSAHPYEEMAYDMLPLSGADPAVGYGVVGELAPPCPADEFIALCSARLGIDTVAVSRTMPDTIARVAVAGGSGSSFIPAAAASGADVFVSGEFGHHDFLEWEGRIGLVDAGHRNTELPVLDTVADRLREASGDAADILVYCGEPPSRHMT